jgi:hypothetical protein
MLMPVSDGNSKSTFHCYRAHVGPAPIFHARLGFTSTVAGGRGC